MNEISEANWSTICCNNDTVDNLISYVTNDVDLSQCAKWKSSSNNQVVVQSPNYFYKIYEEDLYGGKYICKIRELLGEIYREEYGLIWDIKTFIKDDKIYQIEKRQKISICTPELISYPNLLINWSNTLDKLERKLQLNKITFQLIDKIPNLSRIKLIRDCVNKYIDYGYYNGNVILLDDADWFLALIDDDGNWISNVCNFYPVEINQKDLMLTPINFNNKDLIDLISRVDERFDQWMLFDIPKGFTTHEINNIKGSLISMRKKMLMDNIKIISSKSDSCLNGRQLFFDHIDNANNNILNNASTSDV